MGILFDLFKKKPEPIRLNIACCVELISGYCQNQVGVLPGILVDLEQTKIVIDLTQIYSQHGLFLFDTKNKTRLLIEAKSGSRLIFSAEPVSYKSEADKYSVIFKFLSNRDETVRQGYRRVRNIVDAYAN